VSDQDLHSLLEEHSRILEYMDEAEDITTVRDLREDLKKNEAALRSMGVEL